MSMKPYVTGKVEFQYYRKGDLWYRGPNGFLFPVPIDDTGEADFLASDKAMLFMRWIKAEMKAQGIMSGNPPKSSQPQVDVRAFVEKL